MELGNVYNDGSISKEEAKIYFAGLEYFKVQEIEVYLIEWSLHQIYLKLKNYL